MRPQLADTRLTQCSIEGYFLHTDVYWSGIQSHYAMARESVIASPPTSLRPASDVRENFVLFP